MGCHKTLTPGIVADWEASVHSKEDVGCTKCHGGKHKTHKDAHRARMPLAEDCEGCHEKQVKEFGRSKHALAWAAMKAMPTTHGLPSGLTDGMKGCGGCHKVGLKSKEEVAKLRKEGSGHGNSSCDACHTRHTFSKAEAREPQACRTCHMGFDHPQWEMYSGSKHGVRHQMKVQGALPETASAPTCQTCHMPEGDHEVNTAWGFLAVRLPMPKDPQWAKDRATILMGLGVLDPSGNPTGRLEVVKGAKVARLTQEDWQAERDKMINVCKDCHTQTYAEAELAKTDELIRNVDKLMAEAIRIVAGLYQDGVLTKPESYAYAYPDLLTFHDAPTEIEQVLFKMFLEHRMRAFQGAFHNNPDYALWYGWSELQQDIVKIRTLAAHMRKEQKH